jgi:hypothetical protein
MNNPTLKRSPIALVTLGLCALTLASAGAAYAQSSVYSEFVTNQQALDNLDLCEGLITDNEPRRVKRVAKPPFAKRYRDPAFGTTVMRITNSDPDGVTKPAYSTMQAWNADESLLLLYRQDDDGGAHILLDGFKYNFIKQLDIVPSDLEEVFWSHTDPDILYYVSKKYPTYGHFLELNVRTGQEKLLRNFIETCGKNIAPTAGGDVLMQSMDNNTFGFRCDTGEDWTMMSYNVSTDTLLTKPMGKGTPFNNWSAPLPLPNGDGFWIQGSVLENDLSTKRTELDMYKHHEHQDFGFSWDKREVMFSVAFDPSKGGCDGSAYQGVGHLIEHDLNTGECRAVIDGRDDFPYTTRGTHISGRATRKPGWVAMSSIGDDRLDLLVSERKAPPLVSEIYLVDTNPKSERVCRVAQHRTYGKSAEAGDYHPYFGEPHATISPSGTRILFGSDWYDSGSVDTYVVELPAYTTLIKSQRQ